MVSRIKITVFYAMLSYILVCSHQSFAASYCIHLQGGDTDGRFLKNTGT